MKPGNCQGGGWYLLRQYACTVNPPRPQPCLHGFSTQRERISWIQLRPIDNISSSPLPRHQWLSSKSAWLAFRRAWVQFPARTWNFFWNLFLPPWAITWQYIPSTSLVMNWAFNIWPYAEHVESQQASSWVAQQRTSHPVSTLTTQGQMVCNKR